jgi:uncharacterized membrane protein
MFTRRKLIVYIWHRLYQTSSIMEIALLLLVIVLLFVKFNSITKQLDELQGNLYDLKRTFNAFVEEQAKPTVEQQTAVVKEIVQAPQPIASQPTEPPQTIDPIVVKPADIPLPLPPAIEPEEEIVSQSWWGKFREQNPDLEQFVGENLISKIGILVLVLGISYFVKYAIDQNWINETARVGIGFLCGAIVMGFAHRLRANYKAFSSVLVAGAIAIFYFTIAIAFHQYHIFGQTTAFVLMVIVTTFSVLISVSYDRMELAILSLMGGFGVPFMISTGSGNYQVLFGYIAILDLGILAIAYYKKWSLVNVLAFVFTSILYGSWLVTKVLDQSQAPYLGAFVFTTIFYLIFTLTNIINNLRTQGLFSKIELSVLMANTAFYFSTTMLILTHFPQYKGLFTIALAFFNFACAWVMYKKFGLDKKVIYLLIGLTLTFATLAIPLQFNGNHITLFWAAEAVLLLWLSQKSRISQFRFSSIVVGVLMLLSLVIDWSKTYNDFQTTATLLLNPGFMAGIMSTASLLTTYYLLKNDTEKHYLWNIVHCPVAYRKVVGGLLLVVVYLTGLFETIYQARQQFDSFDSAASLPIAYHLVFSTLFVLFFQKTKSQFVTILSMVNISLYILVFSSLPLAELKDSLILGSSRGIAFWLHYINLACIIYAGFVIWNRQKAKDTQPITTQKWFVSMASLAVIFVASSEVMLHGLAFSAVHDIATYEQAQTLLIKVALPILWGILSFAFLMIGIKNQWRNLRIVALILLGITIVKLFFYDISNVSETGKIIAFILLGIMILVMSFAYQKIKKMVLNPEENTNNDEIH